MAEYDGPIVDVDVHHRVKTEADLFQYLPKKWLQDSHGKPRLMYPISPPATSVASMLDNGAMSAFTFPTDGSLPGSDYPTTRRQLLDAYPYFRAVLTHQLGDYANHLNQYFAQDLCRAANDWNIDRWLSLDERLCGLLVIPSATPEEAVAEIGRVGRHPQIVGLLMPANAIGRPYGDPLFHPIYKAAAELGLVICFHPGSGDRPNLSTLSVGGPKGTHLEHGAQFSQQAMHYLSSLIVHGVFEKYSDLRVLVLEYGFTWLPSFIWRLDAEYELLRRESPWVKRRPSEYIHSHVKFSTQPIEESSERGGLVQLISTVDGMDDLLCFSTDYPHISRDEPDYVARLLPRAWLRKVFCDNACSVYGWKPPLTAEGPSFAPS